MIFANDRGQHLRRTRVSTGSRSWFKTALMTVGLEAMTLHDLHQTSASPAISSGANMKAVQRMRGHASAAMTLNAYADFVDETSITLLAPQCEQIVGRTIYALNDEAPPILVPLQIGGATRCAETEGFEPSVPSKGTPP